MRNGRKIIRFAVVMLFLPVVAMVILSSSANKPAHLGVDAGRFAPCPASPNCVSTQCPDGLHGMAPIPYTGTQASAVEAIKEVLGSMPRVTIEHANDDYLHATARSAWFRFTDDVEFFVDAENQQIHFRAASRVGYSDLGANRARMSEFRKRFENLSIKN